jgi:hypothetical protein
MTSVGRSRAEGVASWFSSADVHNAIERSHRYHSLRGSLEFAATNTREAAGVQSSSNCGIFATAEVDGAEGTWSQAAAAIDARHDRPA